MFVFITGVTAINIYNNAEIDIAYDERIIKCEIVDNDIICSCEGLSLVQFYHTEVNTDTETYMFITGKMLLQNKVRSHFETWDSMAELNSGEKSHFSSKVTIDKNKDILDCKDKIKIYYTNISFEEIQKASEVVTEELKKIFSKHVQVRDDILVVGLGNAYVTPDSLGPKVIKDIDVIYTDKVSLKNVNSSIDIEVPIHFENLLNSDTKTANIKIEVEKYTEAVVNVPVKNNSKLNLRLFPDKVKVKYIVSLTDYSIINENHFNIIIDSADINSDNNLIPIYLIDYPNNTKITSIEPKQLEYIIIEEDEN